MSDPGTDDTDALIACKPQNFEALENFLGLTLGEISNKINALTITPVRKQDTVSFHSTNQNNLDSSDFFNSQGELVLSGLSEWSDEESDDAADAHSDLGSDASTASTNSITVLKPSTSSPREQAPNGNDENAQNEEGGEAPLLSTEINKPHDVADTRLDLEVEALKEAEDVVEDVHLNHQHCQSHSRELQCVTNTNRDSEMTAAELKDYFDKSTGNMLQFSFDRYKSPNYGVRYSPGFARQGINVLKPSLSSGWRVPPGLENDPQIFTRAPNFRTPGGYKPPLNEKPPRDLTEEELKQEVRRMYAYPEEHDNKNGNEVGNKKETKEKSTKKRVGFSESVTATEAEGSSKSIDIGAALDLESQIIAEDSDTSRNASPSLQFDFTNGSKEPPEFGGKDIGMKGKPTKRKHIHGEGGTVGSIPNLNFGLRDLSKLEVKENQLTSIKTWVTGNEPGSDNTEHVDEVIEVACTSSRSVDTEKSKPSKKVNFSELNKLWRDIRDTKLKVNDENMRKQAESNLKDLSISEFVDTHALNFVESISCSSTSPNENKSEMRSPNLESHYYCVSRETGAGISEASFQNVRGVKKPSSEKLKYKGSTSSCLSGRSIDPYSRQSTSNTPSASKEKFETLSESDLDSILQEADIEIDDFEDILDKFSEEMPIDELFGEAAAYSKNEKGEEMVLSLDESEISDWAKSGAGEYLEKFHEEKYKRQLCENEIESLQKQLLELKQQNAVLDGSLKKKDSVVLHISMLWSRLSKEWKAHESFSKAKMAKLLKDQQTLIVSCRQSRERILQYEKELAKAVEVADSFKAKIRDLEENKNESIQQVEEENKKFLEKLQLLENLLEESRNEKEVTVRALRESQIQLDQKKLMEEKLQSELMSLRSQGAEHSDKLSQVCEQKNALEHHLQSILHTKQSLETKVANLTTELKEEAATKDRLEREFESSMSEKVKEESDRLHEYYNAKVHEIMTAATEKAAAVEFSLLNTMKKTSAEADQKLMDCKARYKAEMESMKNKYETEMQVLIRENTQKQNLIAATAQQLQSGELAISKNADRLQNIVSNFSKPSLSHNGLGQSQLSQSRPRGSESNEGHATVRGSENGAVPPASYQILNGHPSKYTRQQPQCHMLPCASSADTSPASQATFDPSHFSRYNASTPIQSVPTKSNVSSSSGNGANNNPNFKGIRPEILQLQLPPLDHLLANPKLLHVFTEMSVSGQGLGSVTTRSTSATCSQLVNPMLSHGCGGNGSSGEAPFICHPRANSVRTIDATHLTNVVEPNNIAVEIPVRLEKTRRKDPEIITTATRPNLESDRKHVPPPVDSQSLHRDAIEPSLHKCLQALVKCYTEKLDQRQMEAVKVSPTCNDIVNYITDNNNLSSNASSLAHCSKTTHSSKTNNDSEINQLHIENKNLIKGQQPSEVLTSVSNSANKSLSKYTVHQNSRRPWK